MVDFLESEVFIYGLIKIFGANETFTRKVF